MASDRIIVSGIVCAVTIGVEDWERERKQPCTVSLKLYCDLRAAGRSDDLSDAIDYAALIDQVSQLAETRAFHLLERLAEEVSALVLQNYPVTRVEVTVRKMQPPIARPVERVAVRIRRP